MEFLDGLKARVAKIETAAVAYKESAKQAVGNAIDTAVHSLVPAVPCQSELTATQIADAEGGPRPVSTPSCKKFVDNISPER
jgi:hypothetical protein